MRRRFIALIGTLLVAGGCASMAPKYARPEAPVPRALPAAAGAGAAGAALAIDTPWKEFVTDAKLRSVIELTLANNRDLRLAALNVERAQQAYRIQRGAQNPAIGATATANDYRSPANMSSTGHSRTSQTYTVALGMSGWEIDFFGRIRSLKDASLSQYLATEQAQVAARIALVAGVSATYLELAADAEGLRLAQSTVEAQQKSLELVAKSRDAGVASDLNVRQAESQVESARAAVARYKGLVALDRNALDLLAGAPVPEELLPKALDAVAPFKAVSAGLASDVLLRRPDILATEYQLKAANANIGAARAAMFPRISLTAGLGFMSPALSKLFNGDQRTWTFAPTLVTPIFTSGSLQANVKIAQANRDAAVAEYEKAIQTAFREVSDSLALRATLVEQRAAQEALVTALDQTYRLSDARYQAGIDGYLGVLVAQSSLFGAQQALVSVRLAEQQNLVALYKVLGGGV